jgi:hypothetical protein
MPRQLWIIAAGCLAISALIFDSAEGVAARGRGGGGGGMHFGGGHFGGMDFGRARGLGGFHFGGRRLGGMHFAGRSHFARMGHFRGHTHFARMAHARALRTARLNHARRIARNAHANRIRTANLRNRANRNFAARTVAGGHLAANAGRQGLASNERFPHGNGFSHARFGGLGHGYRGFWAGGVFWPYFFGDYISFVFWPYDYYGLFLGYGPDVLLWSAFWPGYDYPYYGYGYYGGYYPAGGPVYAGDIYSRYRHIGAARSQPAHQIVGLSAREASASCAMPGLTPRKDGSQP